MSSVLIGVAVGIIVSLYTWHLANRSIKQIEVHMPDLVTPARATISEVEEEIRRISAVLDHGIDGVWDWNILEDSEYYSPRFFSMLGYGPNDFPPVPETWQGLIHPEDLTAALVNFEEHVRTGGKWPYWQRVRYKHKDGHYVTILCRGHVVSWDLSGNPLRMVGTHTILDGPPNGKAEDDA